MECLIFGLHVFNEGLKKGILLGNGSLFSPGKNKNKIIFSHFIFIFI
jgi:hypothetical protein